MKPPKTKTINVTLVDGGVGDHMASLVAIDYIARKYPWILQLVWMPDLLCDLAKNLLGHNSKVECWSFTEMRGRYTPSRPTKTTQWDGMISPMKIHSLDYAFLRLVDENPPIEEKNYLQLKRELVDITKFDLPPNYVVLATGFTAAVREWPAAEITKVAEFIRMRELTPVFIGNSAGKTGGHHTIRATFQDGIDFSKGINLIDKTTLTEGAAIIWDSLAICGVDNGLLHVAGCTNVPIIGGFTTVSPEIRMPVRNNTLGWNYFPVNVEPELECKHCQQKTNFIYGHDYRNCLHKGEPKENICTKQMTADKFIWYLNEII